MGKKDSSTEMEKIGKLIYKDLGHPALSQVGNAVGSLIRLVALPITFLGLTAEELEKIMKAQTARGIDFESGGLLKRVKSMVPIIVPLFVAAIRRANDLAMAMESRCYHGGVGRTKLKPLKYEKRDKIAYIVLFVFLAVMIYLSFFSPWR